MTGLLRGGFYRLTHSAVLLIALLVILAADVFLNSRCDVTSSNMRELPMLCTMSEFSAYAESSNMSVTTATAFFRKRGQLESSDAADVIGVFQDIHPFQFRWVLAAKRGMLAIPIIFAIVFLALDFDRRSFNNALYTGFSRNQVYFAKLILLFVSGFLVSLAGICALTGIYAGTVFTRLPGGYVWSRLLAHALMDCALMAPPLLAVCLIRKTVISGGVIVAYDLLLRFTGLVQTDMDLWGQGGNLLPVVLLSLLCILLCAAAGWIGFRKARLP
ncbi:MAG: hypothetical protein IKP17_06225 [Oscillospiraceae bacterium]|nr:hypothetical protein [Oscillospiraceae bacterium]